MVKKTFHVGDLIKSPNNTYHVVTNISQAGTQWCIVYVFPSITFNDFLFDSFALNSVLSDSVTIVQSNT